MKQLILMNKETGEVGLGIRIQLFDNLLPSKDSLTGDNSYILAVAYDVGYHWLIFAGEPNEDHPWVFQRREFVDKNVEILGEL